MSEHWVCIGHSHAAALARAGDPALDVINLWDTPEPWLLNASAIVGVREDLASRIRRGRIVLSLLGGSAHTVLGMVEHSRAFDVVLPSNPDLPFDETRELVPVDAVRRKLTEISAEYLEALGVVARTARGPVIHVGPPPPVADAARIAPHVPWGYFPGQPRVIAPKWVRYKLWRLQNEVLAETCARLGVCFMPAPPDAADGEGFLQPRYDADGAHANGAYGALVIERVRSSR